jgi:hypothetical protein
MENSRLIFTGNRRTCLMKSLTPHRVNLNGESKLISGEFDAYVEKVLRASIEAFEPRIPKPLRAKAPAPLDLSLGDSLMALGAQISTMSLEPNGPVLPSVGKVSPFLVPEREHPLSPIQKFLTGTERGLASIAKCLLSPTTPSNGWACYMYMSLSPTIAAQMGTAA